MKQIVVISGKGGTGKTSIAASFSVLADNALVIDCDVDAANMYLLLKAEKKYFSEDFYGGKYAVKNPEICMSCGKCLEVCRFQAISSSFDIDPSSCEGCAFCSNICPNNAIEMKDRFSGRWFISKTCVGPLVHARLEPGEENSGKLVSKIKMEGIEIAKKEKKDIVIVDGPPGIGCPLMASLSGADFVVIVTEPTCSGLHDMKRVLVTVSNFGLSCGVVLNKWDINKEKTAEIEKFCLDNGFVFLGRITFDRDFEKAISAGIPPVNFGNELIKKEITLVWERVLAETKKGSVA